VAAAAAVPRLRLEVAVQPLQPHAVDRPLHGRVGPDLPGGLVEHPVHDRRPADALDVRELGDGVEHGVDEPGEVVDDLRAAPGLRLPFRGDRFADPAVASAVIARQDREAHSAYRRSAPVSALRAATAGAGGAGWIAE